MNNKELIMNNALELFSQEGYEGVGVKKIVTSAGVTKPTMYHYFGNKEGLLTSIYESYFNPFLYDLKDACSFDSDVMTTIKDLIALYIDFAKVNPKFFWLSNHLRRSPRASVSYLIVEKFYVEEEELVESLMSDISSVHGNLQKREPLLAMNLLNLVNGFIENRIFNQNLAEVREQDVEFLMKQFLYGIFSL